MFNHSFIDGLISKFRKLKHHFNPIRAKGGQPDPPVVLWTKKVLVRARWNFSDFNFFVGLKILPNPTN